MKKYLLLFLASIGLNTIQAQTSIEEIEKDCSISFSIENKEFSFFDTNRNEKKLSTGHMRALLSNDVICYCDLEDKYDTDLKKSVFKKSDEYKKYLSQMSAEQNAVKQQNSYVLYNLKRKATYDMNTKSFNFRIDFDNNDICSAQGFYSFGGGLALSFPASNMSYKKVRTNENNYGYWNYNILKTPTISEETALKIEENISSVSILVVYKIESSKNEKIPVLGLPGYTMTMPVILGKAIKTYIVNRDSGEVYADISSICVATSKKKVPNRK